MCTGLYVPGIETKWSIWGIKCNDLPAEFVPAKLPQLLVNIRK